MNLNIIKIKSDSFQSEKSVTIENAENKFPLKMDNIHANNLIIFNYLMTYFEIPTTSTVKFSYSFDNSEKLVHCAYDFIQHPLTKEKEPIFFSISKVN